MQKITCRAKVRHTSKAITAGVKRLVSLGCANRGGGGALLNVAFWSGFLGALASELGLFSEGIGDAGSPICERQGY